MLSKPRPLRVPVPALTVVWIAIGVAASQTAAKNPLQKSPTAPAASFSLQGKHIFTSSCAQCHGLDGKGSERAPNIADRPAVRHLSDAQISGIVENGVPGTGMPAFHSFEPQQVKAVVTYLRTLQGKNKTVAVPGNPQRGKAIFFGKGRCSDCHMIAGQGGFIASDLSDYAHIHVIDEVRQAIIAPAQNTNTELVTVTLRDGDNYSGRIRNEDNFSLQLETMDGEFHFFSKLDISKVEHDSRPLMPSDYGTRFDSRELDDLMSYLMTATKSDQSIEKKQEEWEQ
jgi:cytochrome c oxidase cbb3-type subunit III